MSMTCIIHNLSFKHQEQSRYHEILAQQPCQGAGIWAPRQMRQQPHGQSGQGEGCFDDGSSCSQALGSCRFEVGWLKSDRNLGIPPASAPGSCTEWSISAQMLEQQCYTTIAWLTYHWSLSTICLSFSFIEPIVIYHLVIHFHCSTFCDCLLFYLSLWVYT